MASGPRPPRHLSSGSKRVWSRIVADYDLAEEPHALMVLAGALERHDRATQARELLENEGLVVESRTGGPRPHPAAIIERDSLLRMARLFRELSLDADVIGAYEAARPPRAGTGKPY